MINWNTCNLILVIISVSSLSEPISTFDLKSHPRNHRLSRSLLKRKISDSNSHPKVLNDIHNLAGCPGEICGTLAGDAVQPLLAGAGECAQQDMADKMIALAKTKLKDEKVKNKLIELAKTYRQTERNTFPDYSLSPSPDTFSLFCQKEPQNSELSGLVQAQSKDADPNLFFDPKVNGKSIRKGSDPRTKPFGKSVEQASSSNSTSKDPDSDDKQGQNIENPDPDDKQGQNVDSTETSSLTENRKNGTENNQKPTSNAPSANTDIEQTKDANSTSTNPETGNLENSEPEATKSIPIDSSEDGKKSSLNGSSASTTQINDDQHVGSSQNLATKKLGGNSNDQDPPVSSDLKVDPKTQKTKKVGRCRPKRKHSLKI